MAGSISILDLILCFPRQYWLICTGKINGVKLNFFTIVFTLRWHRVYKLGRSKVTKHVGSVSLLYLSRVNSDLADSKIDSFKFYYCEKSENLHSCLFIYCIIKSKAQRPNVNTGLDTSQNKALNLTGLIVTSANILG